MLLQPFDITDYACYSRSTCTSNLRPISLSGREAVVSEAELDPHTRLSPRRWTLGYGEFVLCKFLKKLKILLNFMISAR